MLKSITKCLPLSLCAFAPVQSAYVGISAGFRGGVNFVNTKNDLKKVNFNLNFLNNTTTQNRMDKIISSKVKTAFENRDVEMWGFFNTYSEQDFRNPREALETLNRFFDDISGALGTDARTLTEDLETNRSDILFGACDLASFYAKDTTSLKSTQITFLQPGISLGAKVLFNITPDGMFKIGPAVGMHFGFGNWKWCGSDDVFSSTSDKRDNYLSVSNPFGFSAGVLAQISFFRFGVDFAAEKLVLKSEMPTMAKLSKALSEFDPNQSIIPANFEQSQTIVDGFCLGLNLKIGATFDLIPNKLKVY